MHNHFAGIGGKANLNIYAKSFQTISFFKKNPTTYIYRVFQQKKNFDNTQSVSVHIYMLKFQKAKLSSTHIRLTYSTISHSELNT